MDYYFGGALMSDEIEILNFAHKYFEIEKPDDIYWYAEHFDVKSVAYCDYNSVDLMERFLSICDNLKVKPIYGVVFTVEMPEDVLIDKTDVICYAQNSKGLQQLCTLCSLLKDETLKAEHLWKYCDDILVGIDFSKNHELLDTLGNLMEFFIIPDFIFVGKKAFYSCKWDSYTFEKLVDSNVLICAKENSSKNVGEAPFPIYRAVKSMVDDFYFLGDYIEKAIFINPKTLLSKIEDYITDTSR